METLAEDADPEGFFAALHAAPGRVLFLDYDGTLAPFREERDEAVPYPGLRPRLERLLGTGHTRLVVVSGRWTRDLLELLGLDPAPELWGSHGWERRLPDGRSEIGEFGDRVLRGLTRADRWAESAGLEERLERKPGCLALHWRGLSGEDAAALEKRGRQALEPLAAEYGLELLGFDGGLELRVPGRDKGDAVRQVLRESGEEVAAAYLGDDLTDEDAFEALREGRTGGRSGPRLSVLVRERPRETAADLWIRPPGELEAFLDRWCRAAAGEAAAEPGDRTGGDEAAP